jgi:Flp pilus assembly protein TadG
VSALSCAARAVVDELGGATAELALALPAVVVVLALALGGVQLGAVRLRAQDAAADAARILARGDPASSAAARVAAGLPTATFARRDDGDLVCVTVTASAGGGPLAGLDVAGTSCALGAGR